MSGTPESTLSIGPLRRVASRRDATRDEIVDAAWVLAREQGLTGWAMRDLGDRVGMKAQSLYGYFASKHDIYDAMFGQGYRAFAEHMSVGGAPAAGAAGRIAAARSDAHRFFSFCVSDPVRFQLLFQRTVPGFEPSAERYAVAVSVLEEMAARLASIGVGGEHVDLWTAVMTGLASQQIANDPGGSRWERLVDGAVDMLLAHTRRGRATAGEQREKGAGR